MKAMKWVMLALMVLVCISGSVGVVLAQDEADEPTAFVTNTPEGAAVVVEATDEAAAGGLVNETGLSDPSVGVVLDFLREGYDGLVETLQTQSNIMFVVIAGLFILFVAGVLWVSANRAPMPVFDQMQTVFKDVVSVMEKEAERRYELAKATPTKLDDLGFGALVSILKQLGVVVGPPPTPDGLPSSPVAGLGDISEVQRMYAAWRAGQVYDPSARPDDEPGGLG